MDSKKLGRLGEDTAKRYLCSLGLKLLAQNWRCGHKEIDLIMEDSNSIRIVEVRSLAFPNQTNPYATIDRKKQNALIFAANLFAKQNNVKKEIIFDIISIVFNESEHKLEYFPNAFSPRW